MERKTLGARIGAMRREKGWTQLELADKMGVTDKAVSKWERDICWPDTASLPKLAALFGLTIDQLIGGALPDDWAKKRENRFALLLLVCKAMALASGVAVVVLSALGELDHQSGFALLGLGLACAGLALLQEKKFK